jgi:hypothetical protein
MISMALPWGPVPQNEPFVTFRPSELKKTGVISTRFLAVEMTMRLLAFAVNTARPATGDRGVSAALRRTAGLWRLVLG